MSSHMDANRAHISRLLIAGVAVVFFVSTAFIRAQVASGDHDPGHVLDSDLIASGPILDQQTADANYATKVALVEEEETRATSGPPAPPKDPNYVPPPVTPEPTGPMGIIDQGPLPTGWGSVYRIENRWAGTISGLSTRAFAGMIYDDRARLTSSAPEQGVLVVMSFPVDNDANPTIDTYLTPTRSGPVRVSSYNGTCLSLTTTSAVPTGTTVFQFDLVTRQWVCSPN